MLRKYEAIVDNDVEHALLTFDQFDVGVELIPEPVRQTGGLRQIASKHAIGDRDSHVAGRFSRRMVMPVPGTQHTASSMLSGH